MNAPAPLPIEELAHRCDAGQFAFAATDEFEDIGVIPGQERVTAHRLSSVRPRCTLSNFRLTHDQNRRAAHPA